jgi:hypothetical protein
MLLYLLVTAIHFDTLVCTVLVFQHLLHLLTTLWLL